VRRSARSREYESAINWLDSAHLIHRAHHITTPKQPLQGYGDDEAFKVYMLDVGLLGAQSNIDPKLILQHEALFQEYNGALTENFVAQMLRPRLGLYYWTSAKQAEVDFLLDRTHQIIPVEVKAAYDRKTKSLRVYESKYQPERLMRLTLRNLKLDDTIENYPLYLAELLPLLE
jgi:predicted AAA+ superfamily ATPase